MKERDIVKGLAAQNKGEIEREREGGYDTLQVLQAVWGTGEPDWSVCLSEKS